MEWVVTTGKTIEEAKDRALDQLGVAADDAEFDIVEEPRIGLFGRLKSEARVRARVKPTQVRPKQERRDRRKSKSKGEGRDGNRDGGRSGRGSGRDGDKRNGGRDGGRRDGSKQGAQASADAAGAAAGESSGGSREESQQQPQTSASGGQRDRARRQRPMKEESAMYDESTEQSDVTPQEVGDAAVAFMTGLAEAFGAEATAELDVDGTDLDVRLNGSELGLLVGPGGRTLAAVQDLARVASQRRLGDHETRLRIDVGGYREKRREALERFAVAVANQVVETGKAKALEPMSSADRKAVHDAINEIEGVVSRSEGDDPNRRVVIAPA